MFGKKLFQLGAIVFSVTLVGTYVYLYSRGASVPSPQLHQVQGEVEVAPAIGAVDQPPVTAPNFSELDRFIGSTKSMIVFPPSSTTPLGSPSLNVDVNDLAPKRPVDGPTFTRDLYFSSSKSGMIIDPSLVPTQFAPSVPAPSKSVQSKSGWVPYVPPEIPPTNQPPIRK